MRITSRDNRYVKEVRRLRVSDYAKEASGGAGTPSGRG